MDERELELIKLLNEIDKDRVKIILTDYITSNKLHSEYLTIIPTIAKDYMDKSNAFIVNMKRDVNSLYVDENFGKNVMKNVDIDEKNWFWYARLLRDTEDEEFAKNNFFMPTYLLQRLKPIIDELDIEKIKRDKEFLELYNCVSDLCKKYNIK